MVVSSEGDGTGVTGDGLGGRGLGELAGERGGDRTGDGTGDGTGEAFPAGKQEGGETRGLVSRCSVWEGTTYVKKRNGNQMPPCTLAWVAQLSDLS
jgi:hypothetical protein